MNDDFDSKFGGESSFGFERKTSSGFASGSFDRETSSGFAVGSFESDNGYNDNNGYAPKPMSYNDSDSYTPKPMSYNDNSGFDASSFSSGSNYDPNMSLYRPENSYAPNPSMYRPSSGFSSSAVNTAVLPKKKNNAMIIIIIALALVVLAVVGYVVFSLMNKKDSVQSFLETDEGKAFVAGYKSTVLESPEFIGADVYMEGDDTLVLEGTMKKNSISETEKQGMELSLRLQADRVRNSIDRFASMNNLNKFNVIFRYKNWNGDVLFEYKVE